MCEVLVTSRNEGIGKYPSLTFNIIQLVKNTQTEVHATKSQYLSIQTPTPVNNIFPEDKKK